MIMMMMIIIIIEYDENMMIIWWYMTLVAHVLCPVVLGAPQTAQRSSDGHESIESDVFDAPTWWKEARRKCQRQWIGLRENLNRKPWFLPSNIGLSCKFSHHPILWKWLMFYRKNVISKESPY